MAKAVKRCGEVWLSMAKEVYVEEGRKLKTINNTGQTSNTVLGQQKIDEATGAMKTENDLNDASFDVSALPGPTSASKRAATVRALMGVLQITQDPETIAVITSMIMMNMEGEGVEEIRDYFRNKLLKMGVVKPTQEEAAKLQQEAQNQPQDPNAVFLQASAKQALADADLKQANTVLATAKAEQAHVDTAATLAGIHSDKIDKTLQVIQALETKAAQPIQQPVVKPQQPPVNPAQS